MKTKTCTSCNVTTSLVNFYKVKTGKYGRHGKCKSCFSAAAKRRYVDDRKKRLLQMKEYRINNIEKFRHDQLKREKHLLQTDPIFKLQKNLRSRFNKAFKHNYKTGSAIKDLGCSINELRQYLETQFQSGMSWDNYGEWHIDHIIPLSSFDLTNQSQVKQACHYSNLQPLWAQDNLQKGANT